MKYIRTENGVEKLTDEEYEARFPKPELGYAEKRQSEYGSWQEQLEIINEQGMDAWKEHINNIKAKYPKEVDDAV